MKKIIVLILALAMLVLLAACNGGGDTSKAESKPAESQAEVSKDVSEAPETSKDESKPDVSEVSEESEESVEEPPEESQEPHVLTGEGDLLNRNSTYVFMLTADANGYYNDSVHFEKHNTTDRGLNPIRFNRWNGVIQPGDTVFVTGDEGQKVTEALEGEYAEGVVYNTNGKMAANVNDGKAAVASGLYLVRVTDKEGNVITRKLMVK